MENNKDHCIAATLGCCAVMLVSVGLASCDNQANKAADKPIRAVKTMTVTKAASEQIRHLSGIIQAKQNANLSFRVAGYVERINVNVGKQVTKNQILAELDQTDYLLKVKQAKANLNKALAKQYEKEQNFIAKKKLHDINVIEKIEFEHANAEYFSAKSEVELAQAKLDITNKNLARTQLKAPFAGIISKREIEPHTKINAGQIVLKMHSNKDFEILVQIPDILIHRLKQDQQVKIRIFSLAKHRLEAIPSLRGKITEIGSSAETANIFPVTISIVNPPAQLRPGISAEVVFKFKSTDKKPTHLIPVSAIVPGKENTSGYVFIYNKNNSTVNRTEITIRNIIGNNVEVVSGIKPGDIIITAGAKFLRQGQKVKLLNDKK